MHFAIANDGKYPVRIVAPLFGGRHTESNRQPLAEQSGRRIDFRQRLYARVSLQARVDLSERIELAAIDLPF
jgi:hypothetical protein